MVLKRDFEYCSLLLSYSAVGTPIKAQIRLCRNETVYSFILYTIYMHLTPPPKLERVVSRKRFGFLLQCILDSGQNSTKQVVPARDLVHCCNAFWILVKAGSTGTSCVGKRFGNLEICVGKRSLLQYIMDFGPNLEEHVVEKRFGLLLQCLEVPVRAPKRGVRKVFGLLRYITIWYLGPGKTQRRKEWCRKEIWILLQYIEHDAVKRFSLGVGSSSSCHKSKHTRGKKLTTFNMDKAKQCAHFRPLTNRQTNRQFYRQHTPKIGTLFCLVYIFFLIVHL